MRSGHFSFARGLGAVMLGSVLAVGAMAGSGNDSLPAPTNVDTMGPIQVASIELDNFGIVDGRIYRGEQPKEEDYASLKALGISTIIDLRNDAKSYARPSAEAAGLKYINIKMDDGDKPYDHQVKAFLDAVLDSSNGKVYVHCAGGRHRTGSTIATYRMVINGWTADKAYAEMKAYDFYTRWGHGGYKDYVFDYFTRMKKDPSSVPAAYTPVDAAVVANAMSTQL